MNEQYDVIVIGAGVGGLASAGLLTQAGYRVLVLERHAVVGGCCSTFRRAHFVFDAAVHAMGGCAPGDLIANALKEIGIQDELRFVSLHPFYSVCVAGETVHLPANLDEMGLHLAQLFPEEANALKAFVTHVKELGSLLLDLSQERSRNALHRITLLEQVQTQSWSQLLANHFQSQALIAILGALCFYAGLEPEKVSGIFMASVFYSYHQGAYYPIGSTQRFVDSLAQAIRLKGGEIRRRSEVHKILSNNSGIIGVEYTTRKNEYMKAFAPVVVSNADAHKTLLEWVGREHLPTAFLRKFQRLERSVSAICLYLAVEEGTWSVPSHETFYVPAWTEIKTEQFYYVPGREGPPPTLSICVPSHSDPGLAPHDHHVVSVTALVHAETIEAIREEKGKHFIEQDLLQHVESLLPGITRCIKYKEMATPRTIERYTNNSDGAMYGWNKSVEQWLTKVGSKAPIPGLYLAGHWAQGGHGIYGAFSSGVSVAQRILETETPQLREACALP